MPKIDEPRRRPTPCVACEGTGRSSNNKRCPICDGTGVKPKEKR